ncbi:hypothetical protein DERF_012450 [Dermatophagoides farinae]|uniref:Uncharacterized protein n=1 Tax=Dermatophagoides farinae TaxID=6954 RepID=A0A922HPL5_DERFA|nr:hypothetical protein DERF_012450 [Dermatophagoides farinae]
MINQSMIVYQNMIDRFLSDIHTVAVPRRLHPDVVKRFLSILILNKKGNLRKIYAFCTSKCSKKTLTMLRQLEPLSIPQEYISTPLEIEKIQFLPFICYL